MVRLIFTTNHRFIDSKRARLAQAGEFTKEHFEWKNRFNTAEAVADLIAAENKASSNRTESNARWNFF